MARLLVLQIVVLFIFFPRSISGTNQNGELQGVADGPILKLARRVLIDSAVGFDTSVDHSVVKTVGATAMGSLATAGVFTFFFRKCSATRRRRRSRVDSSQRINIDELILKQRGRNAAGILFEDDDGDDDLDELDLIYWRKLESGQLARKVMVVNSVGEEVRTGFETEVPWNAKPYKVTTPRKLEHVPKDQVPVYPISQEPAVLSSVIAGPRHPTPPPPPSPPPPPPTMALPKKIPAPPPPPPLPARKGPALPPRSPMVPANRTLPKQGTRPNGVKIKRNLSVRPPAVPRRRSDSISMDKGFAEEENIDASEVKLKPLHWDKVVANTEHSMVWDEINNGSFRFDDELMVSLFGYTHTASKEKAAGASTISGSKAARSSPAPAQEFILEPRKSQNIAIVLKSLSVSRKEILEALLNGEGLSTDQLEKLSALSPTQEETSKILNFDGNPTKLATAESFLYHILKALPSAFTRINAMLFRSVYDPEILHHKESLQTLELGCKELRNSEIFVRLLEAILKAGNKLNAGTARGNAQGFHLTALKKVADVRSVDGKTTLLHFVIEQVVRSEGKRSNPNLESIENNEEKDKEHMILGLPILQGLSAELSNVKKSAAIEHESFISLCSSLSNRVVEIKKLVSTCHNERGGFVLEMKGFLEGCEEELRLIEAEQMRVLELVKRTTEYYQAGSSKEKGTNPFQLFVIIKDFLDMVDQVCIGITQKLKAKKMAPVSTSPPSSPAVRNLIKLPDIPARFFQVQSRHSTSGDSDSEGEF